MTLKLRLMLAMLAVCMLAGLATIAITPPAHSDDYPTITVAAVGDMACDQSNPQFNSLQGKNACKMLNVSNQLIADTAVSAVLGLGDYQYDCGDLADYQVSYNPTWGRVDYMMQPSAGNHEYKTGRDVYGKPCPTSNTTAQGYFSHFLNSHPESKGHFSFDLGAWHLIALNANCQKVGGCTATSPETTWLKSDLASTAQPCIAAFWHQPRFQGLAINTVATYKPWWDALYAAHADLVLNGHIHNYQRYPALNPAGTPDANGITEYVVGTGGEAQVALKSKTGPMPQNFQQRFGYLHLELSGTGWTSRFVDQYGATFDDFTGTCH